MPTPRPLSHDERKAADAAFAGRPFNPHWSAAARRVYEGLSDQLGHQAPLLNKQPAESSVMLPRTDLPASYHAPSLQSWAVQYDNTTSLCFFPARMPLASITRHLSTILRGTPFTLASISGGMLTYIGPATFLKERSFQVDAEGQCVELPPKDTRA
mgnify:CR=1 FL=1